MSSIRELAGAIVLDSAAEVADLREQLADLQARIDRAIEILRPYAESGLSQEAVDAVTVLLPGWVEPDDCLPVDPWEPVPDGVTGRVLQALHSEEDGS